MKRRHSNRLVPVATLILLLVLDGSVDVGRWQCRLRRGVRRVWLGLLCARRQVKYSANEGILDLTRYTRSSISLPSLHGGLTSYRSYYSPLARSSFLLAVEVHPATCSPAGCDLRFAIRKGDSAAMWNPKRFFVLCYSFRIIMDIFWWFHLLERDKYLIMALAYYTESKCELILIFTSRSLERWTRARREFYNVVF